VPRRWKARRRSPKPLRRLLWCPRLQSIAANPSYFKMDGSPPGVFGSHTPPPRATVFRGFPGVAAMYGAAKVWGGGLTSEEVASPSSSAHSLERRSSKHVHGKKMKYQDDGKKSKKKERERRREEVSGPQPAQYGFGAGAGAFIPGAAGPSRGCPPPGMVPGTFPSPWVPGQHPAASSP
jgi:hypothetical protein